MDGRIFHVWTFCSKQMRGRGPCITFNLMGWDGTTHQTRHLPDLIRLFVMVDLWMKGFVSHRVTCD